MSAPGVLISSINNMPAQLPREATDFFGSQLQPFVREIVSWIIKARGGSEWLIELSEIALPCSMTAMTVVSDMSRVLPMQDHSCGLKDKNNGYNCVAAIVTAVSSAVL